MTKKIFLSLMAVLGLLLSAHAQEREITGSVKDHAGAGIVGATILVEGTTKGTTSGADGSFSIKAAPDNVLVVSSWVISPTRSRWGRKPGSTSC